MQFGTDRTTSFLGLVKQNEKIQGKSSSTKDRILSRKKKVSQFIEASKLIQQEIEKLSSFLKEHQKEYVAAQKQKYSRDISGSSLMSEKEREEIDKEAKTILKSCNSKVDQLKSLIEQLHQTGNYNTNTLLHWSGIIANLYQRLQSVSTYFAEMKSFDFKQAEQVKNGYLKLPPKKITNNINNVDKYSKITANKSNSANNESSISEDINNSQTRNEGKEILNITDERERQLLEEENASLMNELETLVDQAKDVEKQIMEISELQNLFALKVAQQSEDIEHNFNIAISSKSNINNAAKELTKATKKGVDCRVFVLLFLIISSFALLFLHSITD